MARIASEQKGGYYPTPSRQVELIAERLRVEPGTQVNLFDPCAGEGRALSGFADTLAAQGAKVTTYGIELEKQRAETARKKIDHVICAPYEDTRVTPHSMSYMWLNPPYDDRGNERAEVIFLGELTDSGNGRLQPGGLLGFCIPQYVLAKAATILALRFENIHVYSFTYPDYSAYNQIVVFGYRRNSRNANYYDEMERLRQLAHKKAPSLDTRDGIAFDVPAASCEVQTFKANILDPEEVKETLAGSPVWDTLKQFEIKPRALLKQPVLPLKPTHIAVAIAAGAVGGNMGGHLLVGATKKVTSRQEIPGEESTVIVETSESRSIVRLFDEDGIHILE